MDNLQQKMELAWFGGIVDGEGMVTMRVYTVRRHTYFRPAVIVSNTDMAIIDKILRVLQDQNISPYIYTRNWKKKKEYKVCYDITVGGMKRIMKLIPLIINHVYGDKKPRLEAMMEYCEDRIKTFGKHTPYTKKQLELINKIKVVPLSSETIEKATKTRKRDRSMA